MSVCVDCDSSVIVVTGYGLDSQSLIPRRAKRFFSFLHHPASYPVDTGGSFPGVKQLVCEAEIKNGGNYTTTPSYVSVAWDSITLPYTVYVVASEFSEKSQTL